MKKKYTIFIIIILLITIVISIFIVRAVDSRFRYSFDINFNQDEEHKSYLRSGEVFILPLPPSFAFAYKHSDSGVTYYSKLSYTEFLKYFIDEGYEIQGNIIIYNEVSFCITEVNSESEYKYYFIDIDLMKE